MSDQPKRANFGFDADFGDLSTVKPTGRPKAKTVPKAKPKPKPKKPNTAKPRQATEASDKAAKAQGFTSREAAPAPLLKKRRRVQHDEPVDQLSIRGPVRVLNGFIDYCEANKLSYWEGLEQLIGEVDQS